MSKQRQLAHGYTAVGNTRTGGDIWKVYAPGAKRALGSVEGDWYYSRTTWQAYWSNGHWLDHKRGITLKDALALLVRKHYAKYGKAGRRATKQQVFNVLYTRSYRCPVAHRRKTESKRIKLTYAKPPTWEKVKRDALAKQPAEFMLAGWAPAKGSDYAD